KVRQLRELAQADPTGNVGKWRSTREALKRAEDLIGPLSDAASQHEVLALRDQVAVAAAAAERDALMLGEIASIRSTEAAELGGSASDGKYARVFGTADIDVDKLGPDAAAERIRARP